MDKSLYLEKTISQQSAIDLLRSMGYTYISPEDCEAQRGSRYHVLLKDILRGQLRRLNRYAFAGAENEFSAANIERAMEDLDPSLSLSVKLHKSVWNRLWSRTSATSKRSISHSSTSLLRS